MLRLDYVNHRPIYREVARSVSGDDLSDAASRIGLCAELNAELGVGQYRLTVSVDESDQPNFESSHTGSKRFALARLMRDQ